MTLLQAVGWSMLFTLAGGSVLTYLLVAVSPWQPDGQLSRPLFGLFLLALLVTATGLGAAVAMALHRRFPMLAGAKRLRSPQPAVALRQGFLFACAVVVNALLAFFQLF